MTIRLYRFAVTHVNAEGRGRQTDEYTIIGAPNAFDAWCKMWAEKKVVDVCHNRILIAAVLLDRPS